MFYPFLFCSDTPQNKLSTSLERDDLPVDGRWMLMLALVFSIFINELLTRYRFEFGRGMPPAEHVARVGGEWEPERPNAIGGATA